MPQVRLQIDGMSCGHCVAAVENGLNAVPGVESVVVDLESGMASIDGNAAADALIKAVVEEGYDARIAD